MKLELKGIGQYYDNHRKQAVFTDINLEVEQGEFICILGPSGCGKSTLLNIIAGLLSPTEGQVLLDGKAVEGAGKDRAFMFQDAALYPWLTVSENIGFGMNLHGVSDEKQIENTEKYLAMVQLQDYGSYRVHQLSGGMKQRVALARALAMESPILLMDEPFSALDKQTKNLLREEVQAIAAQTDKTVILVTHSVEEAVFFADRILIMGADGAGLKNIVPIGLGRPRDITGERFVRIRHEILKEVRQEITQGFGKGEKIAAE